MIKDSAFPSVTGGHLEPSEGAGHKNLQLDSIGGMSLRDYFAGQALAGTIAAHSGSSDLPKFDRAARMAYDYADAMLAEREKART